MDIGSVVQMMSGGPYMTVEDIDDDGMVDCIWFEKTPATIVLRKDTFDEELLIEVPDEAAKAARSNWF